ncbi:histidine utilization repressor [Rhodococcus sp. TAF43]|uniref:histidine utilization repressor n=1 Tax=unclassified Rhodococcus (in: high G+C Gram-positive bacteria) TaxID=192944 RepID=UPI0015820819|nr:histidine utilization repressor [Rhodococcus sp. W8901]QKT14344.1 histidine utilization repressor [Rhodococcus sp. W8901]
MAIADVDAELAVLFDEAGSESVPAYERVKNLVVEQIRSGRWTDGDQLPSENQFVNALGLSRMTINRALRELTHDGLIVRMMGVGTFVASSKTSSPLFEVKNIADEIQQRGHRHRTETVFVREEEPDHSQAFLRDAFGARVFHSLLVHYEDDTPIQVEDRFVNPDEAPDYLDQDFTSLTPNDYLTRVAPLVRGEHVVEAVLASPEECRLLRIDRGEPCLLIRRRTWSERGLVSLARLTHPGSRNRLEGSFTR